ncbi:hypothetical protein [Dyadobacter sp. OTU695]|uniref:hypothetical protein n=1 Tax=Dyadobacter sp. OTU695 TaxID=3043860 RepID=UPI00313DD984
MIKLIELENIKGIGSGSQKKTLKLDLLPNKPSLLVAPNGFGKSSITAAFKSLNRNKIKLNEDDYHRKSETLDPKITIRYKDEAGTEIELYADKNSNSISHHFDHFVINNQVRAKGTARSFGGANTVSASLNIDPIILIDNIPPTTQLEYTYGTIKTGFGNNGKVLPNLGPIFSNLELFSILLEQENLIALDRCYNSSIKEKINQFILRLNSQPQAWSKTVLLKWIEDNEIDFLNNIDYLNKVREVVFSMDLALLENKIVESYLISIQLINLYHLNKFNFKSFCKRKEYERDKASFRQLFDSLNSSWIEIRPKEKDGSLILDFPKPHLVSNGQRDVISFMALLEKARKKLKKNNSILIIDEVFDYLDEANLVAVQYYTTQFIEEYKQNGRKLYLIIFTHLDPDYFKGYVFGRKHRVKVHYLNKSNANVHEQFIKVLKERNIATSPLKNDIEKHLLHYHTSALSRRADFDARGLKPTWGEGNNFDQYIFGEVDKYCNNEQTFDPLAVCCAVRKKIEEKVYNLINEPDHQNTYLNDKDGGTNEKLEYAENIGINVNEMYYFLGIIYNEALHWKDDRDNNSNISPALGKLNNLTIKALIKSIFN